MTINTIIWLHKKLLGDSWSFVRQRKREREEREEKEREGREGERRKKEGNCFNTAELLSEFLIVLMHTSIDSIQWTEKTRNGSNNGTCSNANKSIKYSQQYEFLLFFRNRWWFDHTKQSIMGLFK